MKWTIAALAPLLLCGCFDLSAFQVKEESDAEAAAAPPAAVAPGAQPQGEASIADVPAKIVEKSKALEENPKLVEVQNSVTGSDPITAYGQAYFSAASRVEILGLTRNIQIHEAANGKKPSYEELMGYYRQAHVELRGLKPWQVYAYDPADGSIVILSDHEDKKRRYDAAGLEFPD